MLRAACLLLSGARKPQCHHHSCACLRDRLAWRDSFTQVAICSPGQMSAKGRIRGGRRTAWRIRSQERLAWGCCAMEQIRLPQHIPPCNSRSLAYCLWVCGRH